MSRSLRFTLLLSIVLVAASAGAGWQFARGQAPQPVVQQPFVVPGDIGRFQVSVVAPDNSSPVVHVIDTTNGQVWHLLTERKNDRWETRWSAYPAIREQP
jgi:hypothetical protein